MAILSGRGTQPGKPYREDAIGAGRISGHLWHIADQSAFCRYGSGGIDCRFDGSVRRITLCRSPWPFITTLAADWWAYDLGAGRDHLCQAGTGHGVVGCTGRLPCHCSIHPPGGATALSAVVGGAGVEALGFLFVLTPVLLNVTVILLVAVLFNYPFAWRRYPASLKPLVVESIPSVKPPISHEDLVYALSEVDSFVDVSERDLLTIYELSTRRAEAGGYLPQDLRLGHYYSNGKYGMEWAVRRIIDESGGDDPDKAMVIFKVVAGDGRRATGVATRKAFARWAKHEVYRDDENWRRVDPASS